ncbi:MAG: energy-coupled thiamine transporter ThiT [Lachnospiraceae bacterium]|nr:energy-coupled thiamine transporter ThiT [Lachnospiraceae bacterium]
MSQNATFSRARMLAEASVMIAISTVLSLPFMRLLDLPYGGSVTIASMLPVIIISYRHGIRWGLLTGFVFGLIQQLLGLKNLSYVTTWQSILAVILLDYLIAFMMLGFGGLFKKFMSQPFALLFGSLFVCILRYACHVISGATVWAGLSIPTNAALLYSFGYNATYMVPETIVTVLLAFEVGNLLDFSGDRIRRFTRSNDRVRRFPILKLIGGIAFAAALIYDVRSVFLHLQNAETGEFDITGLSDANWIRIAVISGIGIVVLILCIILDARQQKQQKEENA